ncbi:Putative kinase-like protein TMKL1 [Zea mays]|jgi:hypothetical protein|uniref:Putative kinase-like protein TMKL1 n=1 Tax=Zea mays TaxID=4577 RepID=A0A1D6J856_MAIZE|nr:Putative kinase-like protein TMKL1 [Zea mays]
MATHGNIRSSNIPLSRNVDGRVSDHGLARLVGVVGYRAPEVVTDPRRTSQKADLYGFGVLLLELLTGKAPTHAVLQHDEGVDLPRWGALRRERGVDVRGVRRGAAQSPGRRGGDGGGVAAGHGLHRAHHEPTACDAGGRAVARIEGLGGTASASTARSARSSSMDEADDRPLMSKRI